MQIMTYAKLLCYLFRVYTSVEMFGVGKIFFCVFKLSLVPSPRLYLFYQSKNMNIVKYYNK